MKKIVVCFIVSIALVLVVGYGVVAPRTQPKERVKVTTQKVEEPKTIPRTTTQYYHVEKDWSNEYDLYSLKDVNIKK